MRHKQARSCHKRSLEQRRYGLGVQIPELRQMRYVVEVAQQRNFTRAADRLHVAQQALSQQVKAVEEQLGVKLFHRTNRGVELTAAGVVFVQEARRVINAAERVVTRTQAIATGESGTIRIAYTLTTVYETLPLIAERLATTHPALRLELREVFGGDVASLLSDGRFDLALCPRTALSPEFAREELRRERFVAALGAGHRHAGREQLAVSELEGELFELWPREMAPGFYDTVLATCRDAGFEPSLDEHAAGSTVWRNIAQGRGVALVVGSLIDQLPRGINLVAITEPAPVLIIDLVWHRETAGVFVEHVLSTAREISRERRWLPAGHK